MVCQKLCQNSVSGWGALEESSYVKIHSTPLRDEWLYLYTRYNVLIMTRIKASICLWRHAFRLQQHRELCASESFAWVKIAEKLVRNTNMSD